MNYNKYSLYYLIVVGQADTAGTKTDRYISKTLKGLLSNGANGGRSLAIKKWS
jgi:hypothetical protein